MQPRQSRGSQARSGGRTSTAARPNASAAVAKAAVLPPKAPLRPVKDLRDTSSGTSSSSDGPAISIIKKRPVSHLKKVNQVWRWHLGPIYAGLGILDITARVIGMYLWRVRYESYVLPRVSDTQREDLFTGQAMENVDFLRLVITGSNSVIRCAANAIILWHIFADLRPAWGLRLMRWITPFFRLLLVLWVFADLMQAFIPNIPPEPAEHRITTPHIFFAQMSMYACGPAYFILLLVMFFDLDAGKPSLVAGMLTSVLMTFSFIYHTVYLFKGNAGKATPVGWAVVTEVAFLTFNVGMAMPRRIIAMPGDHGKKWYPRFLREGKVRVYEDTSAKTGSKPLIFTGQQQADEELNNDDDAFLRRQQEELSALNAQFRSLFGSALDTWDADATAVDTEAVGHGGDQPHDDGGAAGQSQEEMPAF